MNPSFNRYLLLLVAIAWASAGVSFAQDSHYWTLQFGNRARLLGGAVIGSASDLSAVYYNPGFIAWLDEPELLLSGTVFQYTDLSIDDALGPGRDLETGRFALSPSLFAGEIRSEALGENRIAYAVLTRQESEFRINERADVTELFQDLPEVSYVSEGAQLDSRLSEYWIGGSWSRKIAGRLAIGVSPFFVIRNHRLRTQSLTQALARGDEGGIRIQARDFDYQHWRFLTKIGMATEYEKWQIGATVTTPSLSLFGSGTTGFDDSLLVTGVGADVSSDFQEGIESSYRSPLSIGFGAARAFGRSRVHIGGEWFDSVSARTILEPEPYPSRSTGDIIRNDVTYEMDSVFNVAVGVEHRWQNDLQFYGSFRTDFSAAPLESASNSTVSTYDLYHLAGGATFRVSGSEFTLGAIYAFGHSLLGTNNSVLSQDLDVHFKKLTFILGISFILGS